MKVKQVKQIKRNIKIILLLVIGAFFIVPFILHFFRISTKIFEGVDDTTTVTTPSYEFEFRNNSGTSVVKDTISGTIGATPNDSASSDTIGMQLNGGSSFVNVDPFEMGGGDMTFEAYVKYNDITSSGAVLNFGSGLNTNNIMIQRYGVSNYITFGVKQTDISTNTMNVDGLTKDTWTHIVGILSSTNGLDIYLNGSLVSNSPTNKLVPLQMTRTNHYIGKSYDNSTSTMNGTIAYLRIWDGTSLTSTEIATLYASKDTKNYFDTGGSSTNEDTCSSTIKCKANNGAEIGDGLCCSQPGMVVNTEHNCPVDYPYCTGYVCGETWGTCVSADSLSRD
tara:strand:+ start:137 stop:1144 length:1008 start_codon:yes stop_codon:yes gene_type:complete